MKHALSLACLAMLCMPAAAQAACYADYKAKQDAPLRLHYGVAEISEPCTPASAEAQLQTPSCTGGLDAAQCGVGLR